MKDGKFETPEEIFQALLNGEKIRLNEWVEKRYIHLIKGFLTDENGNETTKFFKNAPSWSIYEEPKKREVIELYETWDVCGNRSLCDNEGRFPYFENKKMVSPNYTDINFKHIINPDKPTLIIDAETFEIVRD